MGRKQTEILHGFHPVREAFRAGRRRITRFYTMRSHGTKRLTELLTYATTARVPIQTVAPSKMAALAQTDRHQGVCIEADAYPMVSLQELCDRLATVPAGGCLLLLDSIVDPHNLGALIRTACCTAVDGIITTKDRSAPPTPAVSKISAGAENDHVDFLRVFHGAGPGNQPDRCHQTPAKLRAMDYRSGRGSRPVPL